jgi:hypothetical protein
VTGRSGLAPAIALALLAGAACDRGPAPVHIASIRIAQGALVEPLREAGLEPPALEGAARDALVAAGFRMGDGDRAHRARLDVVAVRLAPPRGTGGVRVEVAVELELAPVAEGADDPRRETGTGSAPLAPGQAGETWTAALAAATREAAGALALGFAEEAKPVEKLVVDLGSPDARVRQAAARVLADRRSPAAVPALLERLQDPDPEVVLRAVGALAQIGDPRAVGPLIEISRRGDGAFTARVARLLGDVGGREAEGYLLVLESGHSDPRVRRAASEALGDLRARRADASRATAGK